MMTLIIYNPLSLYFFRRYKKFLYKILHTCISYDVLNIFSNIPFVRADIHIEFRTAKC